MITFKILQQFLLPSVFLFILLIAGLVLFNKKIGKIFVILSIFLYYVFSISPTADLIIYPLEGKYRQCKQHLNTVVVLTGGVKHADLPLTSKLSKSMLYRTVEALRISFENNKNVRIIISGNNPINKREREAIFVEELMKKFGVPEEKIIVDTRSRNTRESAFNLKLSLRKKPFLLVTSAYHMPRALYIFKRYGTNPIPCPCDFERDKQYNILDFFPNPRNLRKCNLAFHEYLGILWYHVGF